VTEQEVITVDARGLSCPQPVILTRKSLSDKDIQRLHVLINSPVARDNVYKYAKAQGFNAEIEEYNEDYIIKIYK